MTTRSKRFMACLLAATLATAPTASQSANLNAEMQAMFNDLGALGNVTSPGAFRGQAMNLYTGGGLMMRAPGRNYPLVNAQLPSLRAGEKTRDVVLMADDLHRRDAPGDGRDLRPEAPRRTVDESRAAEADARLVLAHARTLSAREHHTGPLAVVHRGR